MSPVLHDKIRDARLRKQLTQRTLAEQAGIPRSQLQILEQGGNVTLSTLQKTVEQLSGMHLDLVPDGFDVEAVRRAAIETRELAVALFAATDRLIRAAGGEPPALADAPPPPGPLPGGAGATRHEAGVEPELLERLQRELDAARRKKRTRKRDDAQ